MLFDSMVVAIGRGCKISGQHSQSILLPRGTSRVGHARVVGPTQIEASSAGRGLPLEQTASAVEFADGIHVGHEVVLTN